MSSAFASTGPRSLERGRCSLELHQEPQGRASTGPRSLERGRANANGGGGAEGGVASTGPRSLERGRRERLGAQNDLRLVLQRGRAHLSAEGTGGSQAKAWGITLQRGRAHLSAEGSMASPPGPSTVRLQRGRAHLSAEGAPSFQPTVASPPEALCERRSFPAPGTGCREGTLVE